MIDNITFNLENIDKKILDKFQWKIMQRCDKVYYVHYLKNPYKIVKDKNYKLKLILKPENNKKTYKLIVKNSLRKWYFNRDGKRDLYKSNLLNCLRKLSLILGLKYKQFLNAKITKIEFGATIPLKPYFRYLHNGICFYPKLNKQTIESSATSTYFGDKVNSSYHLIFYDKLALIYKNTKKEKLLKNLNCKIFFMRYEISVNKVSKVKFYKENTSTFKDLIKNWDIAKLEIYKTANKVKYVDCISDFNLKNIRNINDVYNNIQYIGIQRLGIEYVINLIANLKTTNNTYYRNRIFKFINENSNGDFKNLHKNFLLKLEKKLNIISSN